MTIPLPVIPNTYRVALRWSEATSSQQAVNVMHFQAVASGTVANDLNTVLQANFSAGMWAHTMIAAHIYQLDIIPLDGTSATQSFPTTGGSNFTGANTGDYVPQVSALVKIQTGLRGRNHRGRVFLPWVAETAVTNGVLASGTVSTMQAAFQTFTTAITAASPHAFESGVAAYDRKNSGAGAHFQPTLSVTVESYTATQRRRQPGRKVSRH